MTALLPGDSLAAFPADAWMVVMDPGPGAPADPAQNQAAVGVLADRADVAAMIAVESIPAQTKGRHTVAVCRPGGPPKLVHLYLVNHVSNHLE